MGHFPGRSWRAARTLHWCAQRAYSLANAVLEAFGRQKYERFKYQNLLISSKRVFAAATGHWKNIWSLGRKNILYFNCLNLGKSCLKNSVDFSIACSTRKKVSKKVILKKTSGVWRPKIYCILIGLNLGRSCLKNSVDFSIACATWKKVSKKKTKIKHLEP